LVSPASRRDSLLALRSLLWVVLMPGTVAGLIPWSVLGLRDARLDPGDPLHAVGVASICVGVALLGVCVWEFARRGRGTLSPVDPPRVLVVRGLYRYVRNPMYPSVTAILLGELALTRSSMLLVYLLVFLTAANVFVIGYEEPKLRSQFGASYEDYTRRVGRWLPRWAPR
jgi:protein-S-isoprenylcysteine O-methyltransferase Ste14